MNEDLTPCLKCRCFTKSIRIGRANWRCEKCSNNKTLSDVFFYEATQEKKDE